MKNQARLLFTQRALANLAVVIIGVTFYLGLSNFNLVYGYVKGFIGVISPFIVGFCIAYLLNLPMKFFETRVFHKLRFKRGLSILAVYLIAVLILGALTGLLIPQLAQSVVSLVGNLPTYLNNLNEVMTWVTKNFNIGEDSAQALVLTYTDLLKQLGSITSKALPQILDFSMALGSGLISAITALISSIYMLASKQTLCRQLKKLMFAVVPVKRATRIIEISTHSNRVFAGFINGKLIDSAIIGVLCYLGMVVLKLPFAVLISTIIGVTNIIPFFGPFFGAVPSIMILLIVDPWDALWFGIFVLALQQFDGNILGPKILGDSTGLSAIWVLISIVVGGGLFGFPGMVLGVPACAVIYSLVGEWVNRRLRDRGLRAADALPAGEDGAQEPPPAG